MLYFNALKSFKIVELLKSFLDCRLWLGRIVWLIIRRLLLGLSALLRSCGSLRLRRCRLTRLDVLKQFSYGFCFCDVALLICSVSLPPSS